jgi:serine/threonine protein kinase
MAQPDVTLTDGAQDAPTIIETQRETDATLVEGVSLGREALGELREFRGLKILEQLPTKGSEADIYLTAGDGEKRVLKLYRHRMEPKLEILRRVTEMSRRNSSCFVVFHETGFDETTSRWYELQEYMPLGSLKDVPADVKRSGHFVSQFIPELSAAVQCLHDNGIIHCDLKPANVLVRSMEPLDLVLTDFGISSLIANDMSRKMTGLKGTPMYWAPEAFSRVVGCPCDWWAFGMILFEMLSGAHPFDGLSDSQIIHRLTIGGVEIPEYFGPEWGMLIEGLLTKDDSRRWGKAEVDRWLAGERDIPVYYERPGGTRPFRFNDADYFSARDLADAIAESEEPWKMPSDYLRFIRTWYESNSRWNEAAAVAESSAGDPVLALFGFVSANSPGPLRLLGRAADAEALYWIAGRAASGEADETEKEIMSMLRGGRLSSFCEEYARHREPDEGFPELADFLRDKTPEESQSYLGAFLYPDRYVLPRTVSPGPRARVESLERLGAPPISRSRADDLANRFILPQSLTALFDSEESYLEGVRCLEYLLGMGLLIPGSLRASVSDGISLADYEAAARVHCYGHSPEMLETIDELTHELAKVSSSAAKDTAFILANAKNRKITVSERDYIAMLSELFERKRKLTRGRPENLAVWGMGGFTLLAVIRLTLGLAVRMNDLMWAMLGLIALLAVPVFIINPVTFFASEVREARRREELAKNDPFNQNPFRRMRNSEDRESGEYSFTARILGLFLVLYMVAFQNYIPRIIRGVSLAFPVIGIFSGAGIAFALYNYKVRRLWEEIDTACDLFRASAAENGGWNVWRAGVPASISESDAGRRSP